MTESIAPALRVDGLSVRLGDQTVLRRVSFSARPGELVALTGPNGSGKTTLLKAALGLVAASEGRVELMGTPTTGLRVAERARRLAWVPQEEISRDNVRLLDYVLYGRYAHLRPFSGETDDDRRRAREALSEAGLAGREQVGVRELSGGERQRLVLARALAQETPILLLDEPTAHLDIGYQLDLLERVRRRTRELGVLAVAALHDLNLAARFADRVLVLSHGRCVADGTPAEVLEPPLLREVWGVEAVLKRDPRTGQPYLVPRRAAEVSAPGSARGTRGATVHVVGGGGAATPILRRLSDLGWSVTTGAVPLLDTDAETAEELGVPFVAEIPFSPLSEEVRARHRAMIEAADAIVVAPFAVGPGNVANLEDLRDRAGRVPVFLVDDAGIGERDFTEGRATALWRALRASGARTVRDPEELAAALDSSIRRAS